MRQSGIEAAVKKLSKTTPVIGICGGFQMLGESIADPFGIEQGMDAPEWDFFRFRRLSQKKRRDYR